MKKGLLLLMFSVSCLLLSAQVPEVTPDDEPPPNPQGDPDLAVPITGLEWLLVGGCALGLKKIADSRKNGKKGGE